MSRYYNSQIRKLRGELRYASEQALRRQVARIKRLLPALSSGSVYPYEYVVARITGFRPQRATALELRGETLIPDLLRLLYDISGRAGLRADAPGEKIFSLREVCERYGVSARTVARWRQNGLVAIKFLWPDGSKQTGFEQSALEAYVKRNAASVERASRFSRITEEERKMLIERARSYARELGLSPSQVTQRLSDELGRSRETIRYALWQHVRENASDPAFECWREPLTRKQLTAIEESFAAGIGVAELARRYDRSPSAIYHIIRLARARKLLARRIHYVHSPLFESRSADQEILGLNVVREPGLAESAAVARSKDGEGTSSPSIYGPPPLRKDEERQLFLRYNYLKFKAAQWQARLAGAYPSQRIMDGLDGLLRDAEQVRERLVRSYLRLVVAVACRHLGKRVVLNDLVSEGNLCLLRAVEKFDAARGNRFSTYLTWALIKTYARTIPEANFESANFLTGQEERLAAAGAPNDARDGPDDDEARKHFIGDMLSSLTDREREVIASRFGLGAGQGASYGEIGKKLGVTKERARQIHGAAMRKLRAQLTPSEKK